jgi:hypothetical protein
MRSRGLLGVMAVLALLVASTVTMVASDEGWTPVVNLSDWQPYFSEGAFRLDLGDDGTQLASWIAGDASGNWALWARVRPPGGLWGPVENLSGFQPYLRKGLATYWDAGVTPNGTAWALWAAVDSAQSGDNVFVMSAHRPPRGSWQPEELTAGFETAVRSADLAIGPDGDLAAAWVACASSSDPAEGPCHVRLCRRPVGASGWGSLEQPDETVGEGISEARVLVGPGGLTVVLWPQASPSSPAQWALMAQAYPPAPTEVHPTNISGWKKLVDLAQPVIDPGGTVTAAWRTLSADGTNDANYANTRPAGGSWNANPAQISTPLTGFRLYKPVLAVGQDGTVIAAWIWRVQATESYLLANARDAGQAWGGEVQLHGGSNLTFGSVSLGVWPEGSAMALFSLTDTSRTKTEDDLLRWTVRPPHGAWGGGGQGELGVWMDSIQGQALKLGQDGSGAAVWGVTDAGRPPGETQTVLAAIWPPGGPFDPPTVISDWFNYTWVLPEGLVVGRGGRPVGTVWQAQEPNTGALAVLYSGRESGWQRIYLPLVVRGFP